jgi:hypothetical protein
MSAQFLRPTDPDRRRRVFAVARCGYACNADYRGRLSGGRGCGLRRGGGYDRPHLCVALLVRELQLRADRRGGQARERAGRAGRRRAGREGHPRCRGDDCGVIVFWPALFMVGGNDQQTAELGRLRGELEAIEQVAIRKKCGIQFQRPAAPAVPTDPRSR